MAHTLDDREANDHWPKSEIYREAGGKLLFSPSAQPRIEPGSTVGYIARMSLTQLKDQAASLQLGEQRELIAFQAEQDGNFKHVLAERIDGADRSHRVELDELKKRYAE